MQKLARLTSSRKFTIDKLLNSRSKICNLNALGFEDPLLGSEVYRYGDHRLLRLGYAQRFFSTAENTLQNPDHSEVTIQELDKSNSVSVTPKLSEEAKEYKFQAETNKLLNIVTHSLYTDKDVFVRELISNASDALEKLRFVEASSQLQGKSQPSLGLKVTLSADPVNKTFTIEDSGIGMTQDELITNLGTIAKSGSLEFLKAYNSKNDDNSIIGQFGVGFYSAFVVSDRVDVYTRSADVNKSKTALFWTSDGSGSFSVREVIDEGIGDNYVNRGTRIVCHLKPDCLIFSNINHVKECAKKFSSFVNFPIYVKENSKEELVASQEALWLKPSATKEEHLQFFRYLSNQSWGEPFYTIMFKADAPLSIKALLYLPSDPPNRLFQSSVNESGVSLHSRRIMVNKAASVIMPRWLWFVKGIIDCDDIPLNVSREHVQDTKLQEKLSNVVVRRVIKFLSDQAKSDPVKFAEFYGKYSNNLKEGILDDAQKGNVYRDGLMALLRYECSTCDGQKFISLDEYIESMLPEQKNIYYYCCPDRQTAMSSPYMEQFLAKKRPVLLMMSDIDEFLTMNVQTYKEKKFVAVDSPDEDFEPLLDKKPDTENLKNGLIGDQRLEVSTWVKEVLSSRVTSVKFSERLISSPAVVSGFLPTTLRKMMKATMQGSSQMQMGMASLPATLELNPSHELITSLFHLKNTNPDVAKLLVEQLYDNACVSAGILEDPRSMLERLNKILTMTAQYAYHHDQESQNLTQNNDLDEKLIEDSNAEKKSVEN